MDEKSILLIRRALPEDAVVLAALSATTFYDAYHTMNTPENMEDYIQSNFLPEHLEAELKDPSVIILMALAGEQPVGYIKLNTGFSAQLDGQQALEISRYYVLKGYQGLRTGTKLMSAALEMANRLEIRVIWLAVWQENTAAISIYEHFGFRIEGTTTFQLGDDLQYDYIMVKRAG